MRNIYTYLNAIKHKQIEIVATLILYTYEWIHYQYYYLTFYYTGLLTINGFDYC